MKPNDERALQLMDKAARSLMEQYPDVILAFGESDEYRFLHPSDISLEALLTRLQQVSCFINRVASTSGEKGSSQASSTLPEALNIFPK